MTQQFATITLGASGALATLVSLSLIGGAHLKGAGRLCVNAKVYKGSVGPVVNVVEFGPGPTEMAIA